MHYTKWKALENIMLPYVKLVKEGIMSLEEYMIIYNDKLEKMKGI